MVLLSRSTLTQGIKSLSFQSQIMGWNYRQSVYRIDVSSGPCVNRSQLGMVKSTCDSESDYAHVAANGDLAIVDCDKAQYKQGGQNTKEIIHFCQAPMQKNSIDECLDCCL